MIALIDWVVRGRQFYAGPVREAISASDADGRSELELGVDTVALKTDIRRISRRLHTQSFGICDGTLMRYVSTLWLTYRLEYTGLPRQQRQPCNMLLSTMSGSPGLMRHQAINAVRSIQHASPPAHAANSPQSQLSVYASPSQTFRRRYRSAGKTSPPGERISRSPPGERHTSNR